MSNYFSITRIRVALENLKDIDSKWLIIPLVFAANGVTSQAQVVCNDVRGTGRYLKNFFDGSLIGLESRSHGKKCNIRPGNVNPRSPNNHRLITIDYSDLWGKTYSQSGYAAWQDGLILERRDRDQPTSFKLGPQFATTFRSKINVAFQFEDFLVWLYAFRGFPDNVASWADLLAHFELHYTESGIPQEYRGVFSLSGNVPWPNDFTTERPSNADFQAEFFPELVSTAIEPYQLTELRNHLHELVKNAYLEYEESEIYSLSNSIVSGLQGCRRLFLYGDPGTGKTELARLIGTAFMDTFTNDRVHVVFAPIAESTSTDKLIGFSTLDGSWVPGSLTQHCGSLNKELLYDKPRNGDVSRGRSQINVVILDEANRRDIEELLVRFQAALDSESADPDHDDFRISLDNSGERFISPNTYLIMTGNSPREDSGRVVQSRPFKRRHNLLPIDNVFTRVLERNIEYFIQSLTELWDQVGLATTIDLESKAEFSTHLSSPENLELLSGFKAILTSLNEHSIGVSFGLVKKILKTAGTRFLLTKDFKNSIDAGFAESVFSLVSSEEPINGRTVKTTLSDLPVEVALLFPLFYSRADQLLREADMLGRVRPFL